MSTVPAGKRNWKCPECGGEILLSVTQLDPIACDACLTRMKGGKSGTPITDAVAAPLGMWESLPESTKLISVVVALILGLAIGFFVGKSTVPQTTSSTSERSHSKETKQTQDTSSVESPDTEKSSEERPDPPGPGYKWVKGHTRKDGSRGAGHWAKDPRFKGDEAQK